MEEEENGKESWKGKVTESGEEVFFQLPTRFTHLGYDKELYYIVLSLCPLHLHSVISAMICNHIQRCSGLIFAGHLGI